MSRGPQTSLEIQREVQRLVSVEGVTSKVQIYGELDRKGFIDGGGSPSKSTVDRLVDSLKPSDPSGPWSLAEAVEDDLDDAGFVLDVLLSIYHRTNGRTWLTKDLAMWVARVRQVSPEIPPSWAYVLAWQYRAGLNKPGGAEKPLLDLIVAIRPWERLGGAAGEWIAVADSNVSVPWYGEGSSPALQELKPLIDQLAALAKSFESEPRLDGEVAVRAGAVSPEPAS